MCLAGFQNPAADDLYRQSANRAALAHYADAYAESGGISPSDHEIDGSCRSARFLFTQAATPTRMLGVNYGHRSPRGSRGNAFAGSSGTATQGGGWRCA